MFFGAVENILSKFRCLAGPRESRLGINTRRDLHGILVLFHLMVRSKIGKIWSGFSSWREAFLDGAGYREYDRYGALFPLKYPVSVDKV